MSKQCTTTAQTCQRKTIIITNLQARLNSTSQFIQLRDLRTFGKNTDTFARIQVSQGEHGLISVHYGLVVV